MMNVVVGWLLKIAGLGIVLVSFLGAFLDFGGEGWPMSAGSVAEVGQAMQALGEMTAMFCAGAALFWAGDTCLEGREHASGLVGFFVMVAGIGLMTVTFLSAVLDSLSHLGELTLPTIAAWLVEFTITFGVAAALFWIGQSLRGHAWKINQEASPN